jgi:hypothetical protein
MIQGRVSGGLYRGGLAPAAVIVKNRRKEKL